MSKCVEEAALLLGNPRGKRARLPQRVRVSIRIRERKPALKALNLLGC